MFVTLTLSPAIDCTLTVEGVISVGGVHRVSGEVQTPGGKGLNVAKVIAAAGHHVVAGGLLGEDEFALYIPFLGRHGIDSHFLSVPYPTRRNIMAVDEVGTELKFNRPAFPDLAYDRDMLVRYATELAARGEVAILSGSLPAAYPDDTYSGLIGALSAQGVTTVLDASGPGLRSALGALPALIKPNRREFEELVGFSVDTEEQMRAELVRLLERHEGIIVSDGERGAYFATKEGILWASAPRVDAIDSTGAGDSLLGQFCTEYFGGSRKLSPHVAAMSVAAGAAAVEVRGTPVISVDRIRHLAKDVNVREL